MKKSDYKYLVTEVSMKLSEKILQDKGVLTGKVKTIDAEIAVIVREGCGTESLLLKRPATRL